jgi:hypothetical protein
MSFADIWDRFFWSLLVFIFVSILWLKFIDPIISYSLLGGIVSAAIAGIYFYIRFMKMRRELQMNESAEDGEA